MRIKTKVVEIKVGQSPIGAMLLTIPGGTEITVYDSDPLVIRDQDEPQEYGFASAAGDGRRENSLKEWISDVKLLKDLKA